MKSASSYELLASVASSDESGKALRMYACTALGDLGDERAVPVLTAASIAADPNVRASAIAALGKFTGKAALAAIREGLRDPHVLPRIAAAKASGDLADSDAVPFLEYKASHDPERAVREAALAALSSIGGGMVDDFLYDYFSDVKMAIAYRSSAFGAVVAKGGAAPRAKALAAFAIAQAEKDRTLFTAFAKAAMAVDSPSAMPFAEALLGDRDFSMRLGGIAWVDRNKARELAAVIRSLSENDPSDAVKRRAAQAMGRLGS
jgi:HEAT repeat protein